MCKPAITITSTSTTNLLLFPRLQAVLTDEEALLIKSFGLLSGKPMLYVANVAEGDLGDKGANNKYVAMLRERAAAEGLQVRAGGAGGVST